MVPAFRAGSKPALFAGACALFLLAACAPTRRHGEAPSSSASTDSLPAEVRAIFVVHGDGDYTWHDSTGRRHRADLEAVKQAREAGALPRGEVFLFHLRKGRTGWLQPSHDGRFEHYRAGRRVSQGTYVRTEDDTALEAEAAILRRAAGATPLRVRLAYFGHELPLTDAPGYFGLHPYRPFSQARLARALGALQPSGSGKPYETLVLSMCYGGNPGLVAALAPYARWLVASPAYLHLSYLDARALADPDLAPAAGAVAERSFARLSANVHTEVTAAVYDLESVRPPLASAPLREGARVWKDCAGTPGFDSASAAVGTRLLYRAPRFGAGRGKATRSAWQCAL